MTIIKKAVSEFIGTFVLLFFGLSMIIIEQIKRSNYDSLTIAFAFSVIMIVLVIMLGRISGAQFNPAVSIGYFVVGKMTLVETAVYVGSQIAGGLAAGLILTAIFIKNADLGAVNPDITLISTRSEMGIGALIVIIEFVVSFVLMFTYIHCTKKKINRMRRNSFLLIGLVYFLSFLVFYKLIGTGLNPIKVFIPALYTWKWDYTVYFISGEIVGAVLGAVSARFFLKK
jgi:glycerol uptake facilitator-like aquaporin